MKTKTEESRKMPIENEGTDGYDEDRFRTNPRSKYALRMVSERNTATYMTEAAKYMTVDQLKPITHHLVS